MYKKNFIKKSKIIQFFDQNEIGSIPRIFISSVLLVLFFTCSTSFLSSASLTFRKLNSFRLGPLLEAPPLVLNSCCVLRCSDLFGYSYVPCDVHNSLIGHESVELLSRFVTPCHQLSQVYDWWLL